MANIKLRPDFPDFNKLYTGVTDDAFSRIASRVTEVPPEARAYGIGTSGVFDKVADDESYEEDTGGFDYDDEETQRLVEALSQETPEAEIHVGSVAHYLHSDFGVILSTDRRNGAVNVESFDDEDEMYETWDQHLLSSRRREI
jgi:hypothetical protein